MALATLALARKHRVFDTDTKLTRASAKAFALLGYDVAGRYVGYAGGEHAHGDLDAEEVNAILDAPMGLLFIQHAHAQGWIASEETGKADAAALIRQVTDYVLAAGGGSGELLLVVAAVLDMEGVGNKGGGAKDHAMRWCSDVRAAGIQPVPYIGASAGLLSLDLDDLPGDPRFWLDGGPRKFRPAPKRDYFMKQRVPERLVASIEIDDNDVLVDSDVCVLVRTADASSPDDGDPAIPVDVEIKGEP